MINYEYSMAADASIEEDIPFPLSRGDEVGALADSIARVGLISPLVLWPWQEKLHLLCGRRRRLALRSLGKKEFPALIIRQPLPPLEALRLAVEDNLHRGFNDAEKALAVQHMIRLAPRDRVRTELLPLLNIPPTEDFFLRYLAMVDLGNKGLDLLAEGLLDPQTGLAISEMSAPDREAMLDLFAVLKPGVNKRRQLIELMQDISRRESVSPAVILQDPEIIENINAPNLNPPQKEHKTRDCLTRRRYPELTAMRERQKSLLKKLGLGRNMRLKTPPGFEGLEFQMEIAFSDSEELAEALRELEQLVRDPALAELIELG
jgi:hypothetical protein